MLARRARATRRIPDRGRVAAEPVPALASDLVRQRVLDDSGGTSTRGRWSTIWLTCATTMPPRNAAASTIVGVSSVFGPV
jgi:hypothetical protein